jgi:hypothetical protein
MREIRTSGSMSGVFLKLLVSMYLNTVPHRVLHML